MNHERPNRQPLKPIQTTGERNGCDAIAANGPGPSDELRNRFLFDTMRDGVLILDFATRQILDVNPSALQWFERPRQDLLGRTLCGAGLFQNPGQCRVLFRQLQRRARVEMRIMPPRSKTERQLPLHLIGHLYELGDRRLVQVQLRDLASTKLTERPVHRSGEEAEFPASEPTATCLTGTQVLEPEFIAPQHAQDAHLEALRRVVDAQETERSRLSRELHDQLGQELTALKLGLKAFKTRDYLSPETARKCAERLEALADNLMLDVHRLAWKLRPVVLDDFGLDLALRRHTEEWAEQTGIPVDFHGLSSGNRRLPPPLETTLYRITQEALTNIQRHAQPHRVSVLLERRPNMVSLIVEDDGQGFDPARVSTLPGAQAKMGLAGMRERVLLVGGTIEIESRPGAGTTIFVRVPLHEHVEAA